MDGDFADLAAIVDLKTEFEALLLVDEAHATGVIGPHGGVGLGSRSRVNSAGRYSDGHTQQGSSAQAADSSAVQKH